MKNKPKFKDCVGKRYTSKHHGCTYILVSKYRKGGITFWKMELEGDPSFGTQTIAEYLFEDFKEADNAKS